MTRNQQLADIRAACIKANPEIAEGCDCVRCVEEGADVDRPIRLADVLLASQSIPKNRHVTQSGIVARWNLRQDDLTQQSDETISFIHSLLV